MIKRLGLAAAIILFTITATAAAPPNVGDRLPPISTTVCDTVEQLKEIVDATVAKGFEEGLKVFKKLNDTPSVYPGERACTAQPVDTGPKVLQVIDSGEWMDPKRGYVQHGWVVEVEISRHDQTKTGAVLWAEPADQIGSSPGKTQNMLDREKKKNGQEI